MGRASTSWVLAALVVAASSACDFFKELDSAESAGTSGMDTETDTGTGSGTGEDGPCGPSDDTCVDQDRLRWCDPETGEVTEVDCTSECGTFMNFSCVTVGPSTHACWCVEPGLQKVYSCTELEACLEGCGFDPTDACANQCFGRTTAETIRMFGALVHCAHAACEATCEDDPEGCAACIAAGMEGTYGGCTLARSVCDADQNDETWP
ncbi:MAG: hypothetical protein D6705_02955 [Deltaproteobacteria bacterium]|nr:MAG: hypothetical protein D6705_02955 [Deltaproteobacteria bacterium]